MIYLVFSSGQETELLLWQYWYNMQANPNQRAFDIGVCVRACVVIWCARGDLVCACVHGDLVCNVCVVF